MARRKYQRTRWKVFRNYNPEEDLFIQICAEKLDPVEREFRAFPPRRFLVDFAWTELKISVEVEGGVFNHGWHMTISGYLKDIEKANLAALNGWLHLRYAADKVRNGTAIDQIKQAIKQRRKENEP